MLVTPGASVQLKERGILEKVLCVPLKLFPQEKVSFTFKKAIVVPCSSGCSYSQPLGCTDQDKVLDHTRVCFVSLQY